MSELPRDNRVAGGIADIEHIMRQEGSLARELTPAVERVIAVQFAHFFDAGQLVMRDVILELKGEIARLHAKIDMMVVDAKADRHELELLRMKLEHGA